MTIENNMRNNNVLENSICNRCIMDITAEGIIFNEQGICNYCTEYLNLLQSYNLQYKQNKLQNLVALVKKKGVNTEYDCIVGVSGGLDSSYSLYVTKKVGLRPLAVHLDNGWNSELAVSNIEKLCKGLDVDLYTHVIDWEEFKKLQRVFFRANVVDIEMLTDHAIIAVLYKTAFKKKIKYIFAGTNISNEGMRMPPNWNHLKIDAKNIIAIYNIFGNGEKLQSFPILGMLEYLKYLLLYKIRWISILDYVSYRKEEAINTLSYNLGWRPYEKKHYESIFTRFYQGYILPQKFNIDKRKLHYSTLICSNQMSRNEAVNLMQENPYNNLALLEEDKTYALRKLEISEKDFEDYLKSPPVSHTKYPSAKGIFDQIFFIWRYLKKLIKAQQV